MEQEIPMNDEATIAFLLDHDELLRMEKALRSAQYTLQRVNDRGQVPPSVIRDVAGALAILEGLRAQTEGDR